MAKSRKPTLPASLTPLPNRNRAAAFLLCWLLVVASALGVVTVRHQNRQAFVALLQVENVRSELQFEHGRLLLERATWTRRRNIVDDAHARLGMSPPKDGQIVTLHLGAPK